MERTVRMGIGGYVDIFNQISIVILSLLALVSDVISLNSYPVFDTGVPRTVSAQIYQTARLNCRVYDLNDKTVVWLRKKDTQVISFGSKVIAARDPRFHIIHQDGGGHDWTLQIKNVKKTDEGQYECQLNTSPKMGYLVQLNIVVGVVEVRGPNQVEHGGKLNLWCDVKGPSPPPYVDWYLNDTLLQPGVWGARGGGVVEQGERRGMSRYVVRVDTKTQSMSKVHSILTIQPVQWSHSGRYTCKSTDLEQQSHLLYVIQDQGRKPSELRSDAEPSTSVSAAGSKRFPASTVTCMLLHTLLLHLVGVT